MSRRILVTGGTGFVGQHLLRGLQPDLAADDVITVLSDQRTPAHFDRFVTRRVDVRNSTEMNQLISDLRPSHTVHLAGIASVHQSINEPGLAWSTNVSGTINLLDALAQHAKEGTLIFVSTAEVYGRSFANADLIDETASLQPLNPYSRSKAAAESAVLDIAPPGMRIIVLRPFNHTGPGQDERFVIPAFASQIARIEANLAEPVLRVGNLSAERDFIDVRDVVRAYAMVLRRSDDLPKRVILNVATGIPRRIGNILEALKLLARREFVIEVDPGRLRPNDIPRAVGSPAAIEKLLGWSPEIPWTATLLSVLEECRARLAARPQTQNV